MLGDILADFPIDGAAVWTYDATDTLRIIFGRARTLLVATQALPKNNGDVELNPNPDIVLRLAPEPGDPQCGEKSPIQGGTA